MVVVANRPYNRYRPYINAAVKYGYPLAKAALQRYAGKRKRESGNMKSQTSGRKSYPPVSFQGRFRGGFRHNKRRPKADVYKVYGSEIVLEHGGTISGTETVGAGHSTIPVRQVLTSVCRGIWRRMLMRANTTFTDWNEAYGLANDYQLVIGYRLEAGGAINQASIIPIIVLSHQQWADQLYTLIMDTIVPADSDFILVDVEVKSNVTGAAIFKMDVTNASVHLNVSSLMKIQNRTAGLDANDDSADSVTNNPVVGRAWTVTGNQLLSMSAVDATGPTSCDLNNGLIDQGVSTSAPTSATVLSKVQSANAYRYCKNSTRITLSPGEIKSSFLRVKRKMGLNRFMLILRQFIALEASTATTADERVALGESRYFQFDKMVDTGVGFFNLTVGYQIDLNIRSFITVKKPVSNRISGSV